MRKTRLLIVDDIPDNRTILSRRLERRGFEVVEADGGRSALDLISREAFDLVLLDILMPDLDGLEVLKLIRAEHTPSALPVIMVTARTENTDVVKALELGANDYLTKPVDFAIALARVQTQVARKHAEDELRRAHSQLRAHVRQLEEALAERDRSEARVEHLSRHDDLTGLGNRAVLHEHLARAMKRVETDADRFALLCLDVNQFKAVNDTCGHEAGDQLLRLVAERVQGCVSYRDTVARLGADEFAIIAAEAGTPDAAGALAHRILSAIAEPCEIGGLQLVVTCSIGVSLAPADSTDPDTLFRNAEMALAGAKSEGRNRVQFFEPMMNARAQARRFLELDLRKALGAGDFELVYQPLYNLKLAAITGFEALLRWNHPEKGLISPSDFIPVAEESEQILALGDWVLRQACEEAAHWPDDIKVAVNVSAVQFRRGTLAQTVISALAAARLSPDRLELELTETALLSNREQASAVIDQLRSLGVRISIDDFGTGYSSLSYLRSLPLNKIKIDKSFVHDLSQASESLAIIRAITSLAESLKVSTTAEGVETEAQLDLLRGEGCTEVQGFFIGRPMPRADVRHLIHRARAAAKRTA
ncbi:MAG TPA: EAL domain-containing protein [Beijerinckiaceae bacterium]|jgi:diguanylate cyclase (GGDEF)-like protein